jgi:hypothetical protein
MHRLFQSFIDVLRRIRSQNLLFYLIIQRNHDHFNRNMTNTIDNVIDMYRIEITNVRSSAQALEQT